MTDLRPGSQAIDRFRADLDALLGADAPLGVAVSGGPDSMALLLLAAAARPGLVHAATVDHRLREGSADEAAMVARHCAKLGVPHRTLAAEWAAKPSSAIQKQARTERYRLLAGWAAEYGLAAVATAHHLDDQAETFVMRLARGSGVKGLSGMRPRAPLPGGPSVTLLRPLLGWRRHELAKVCEVAGIDPVADPSNADEQFERVRIRRALEQARWLDPVAMARSASNLALADGALHWATTQVWDQRVNVAADAIHFDPVGLPREILWRLVRRAILRLASEGGGADLRGRELDQLLDILISGHRATLRGVLCTGGKLWRFVPAPNRTRRKRVSR